MADQSQDMQSYNSDEIDLRALFSTLWQGRIHIFVITLLFTVAAAAYAMTAQEWWTAKAIIDKPQLSDYQDYYASVKELDLIFSASQDFDVKNDLGEFQLSQYIDPSILRAKFVQVFNSQSSKGEFLLQDEVFLSRLNGKTGNKKNVLLGVKEWGGKISAVLDDKKQPEGIIVLKFQSTGSTESAEQLQRYIDFSQARASSDLLNNLLAEQKAQQIFSQLKLDQLIQSTEQFVKLEIQRYRSALNIAASAFLNSPLEDQKGGDYFPIQLGSKAIEAKLKELQGLANLSLVNPGIAVLTNQLERLKAFELNPKLEFSMFSYVDGVGEPLTRDKPKRALIVVTSTILGFFLGLILVYTVAVLRSNFVRRSV